ncbi:universal stress protein [Glycomyces harbinensis]|uniref:Nucleotide-binding universal stress protein, UspA family n=1 Tax=Glycomyces harbinensis TaxID=58114 RepID=A0A1G6VZH4_9ACTN|nr:universal stress protein [Glycomyces harbinensis]SDD58924.1 Nucleotide-binding universal stress protein, UspA family [Glycomyces harbinensis]
MDQSAQAQQRIVVGVDGSPASVKALGWALGQAELTGAKVEAVQAWEVPVMYGTGMMVLPGGEEFDAAAKRSLEASIAQAAEGRPNVQVEATTVAGHPAKTVIDLAEGADLLVVGSRGHGGFVGTLVGSVSQYCVAHATCPVVVVRDQD